MNILNNKGFFLIMLVIYSCSDKSQKTNITSQNSKPDTLNNKKNVRIKIDTLYSSSDTIILKEDENTDTLLNFHPVLNEKNYYAKALIISPPKKLDFSKFKYKRLYRSVTKYGVNTQGVNFAGHYCFVEWGCGTNAQLGCIVDMKTGIVYNAPDASLGYSYKKDSKILFVNPPDHGNWYSIQWPEFKPAQYEWNGYKFILLN